ncbi:MAG: phage portal protein, partial [Phycisphaerae bacterium]|nr:phage portal protein [Phycisphaerae bacterium]
MENPPASGASVDVTCRTESITVRSWLAIDQSGLREHRLARKFRGTDNAFRWLVTEGGLKAVTLPIPHKDMQFIEQQRWGVEEVARVFEMSPTVLGSLERATDNNSDNYDAEFWDMIRDQVDATLAELNEFFLWPDFGDEFEFEADYSFIPALQEDAKRRADIDAVYLDRAVLTVNDIRRREGMSTVPWGDRPILPQNMVPLALAVADVATGSPEMDDRALVRALRGVEADLREAWERRLRREMRRLFDHLDEGDHAAPSGRTREVTPADVASFDWDWWDRYGAEVIAELVIAYETALTTAGFVSGPVVDAHTLAVRYASARAAELLVLD